MALVSFAKINAITPAATTNIAGTSAVDGTTDTTRTHLFDAFWGYFIFGQTLVCEYNEANVYRDVGQFTIQGIFTPNAVGVAVGTDDQTAFNAMVAKYTALETAFETMTQAAAPANYAQWGTASDPRCMALPAPLVDKDSHKVYAIPQNLRIEKTTFPTEIRYVATLREAKMPLAKALVNGFIVDNCVLNITLPSPQFARHQIVGTSGEVLQLKHYQSMEVDLSGSLPLSAVNQAVSEDMKELTQSLTLGTVTLETVLLTATGSATVTVFDSLAVVDDPSVDFDYNAQATYLSVKRLIERLDVHGLHGLDLLTPIPHGHRLGVPADLDQVVAAADRGEPRLHVFLVVDVFLVEQDGAVLQRQLADLVEVAVICDQRALQDDPATHILVPVLAAAVPSLLLLLPRHTDVVDTFFEERARRRRGVALIELPLEVLQIFAHQKAVVIGSKNDAGIARKGPEVALLFEFTWGIFGAALKEDGGVLLGLR